MSIAVTSHVGRDLLQNAAYFNSAPKVVMEYVSNSIDNAPEGQSVRVDVMIDNSEIVVRDNASGMSQDDLMHFFTMHGVNRQRKRGRKVRGRFGTGKSAAFGIADGLRVETVKNGRRNVVDLHRERVLEVPDGSAIPVDHVVSNEFTYDPNGTLVTVYDLQLDRIFITPIRERLERALGRHLDMHEVYINNRRLKYRRPELVGTFTYDPPDEILELMPYTGVLKVSVAREALTSAENGVAVLSNGFLNAMTLGSAAGKAYTERIFGEVEVPNLDDERDDEHFPAFDNTRDLSLNQQNPRALMILEWVGECVEEVRKELDLEAQLQRLSEVTAHMEDAADFVAELINADFARVQRRLRVATQDAANLKSVESSEVVEIEVERPAPHDAPPAEAYDSSAPDETPAEFDESQYPTINYDEPDEPDAVPLAFEEPPAPEITKEEASPDEAYEAFVEYMAELDQLEEEAYHEAVMAQLPTEDRTELVQDALLGDNDAPEDRHEEASPDAPSESSFGGNSQSGYPYQEPAQSPTSSEVYRQHVMSDHRVLLTNSAEDLQTGRHQPEYVQYEEHWVVDRDTFVAGDTPDVVAQPEQPPQNGNEQPSAEPPKKKKYKKPRRRTYFHIAFEHMGEEAARSRFADEGRKIYINRDHPQIAHTEETEGVESLAYKSLMNEIVIHEYASAVVRQMASTGFYVADPFDAVETIQAVVNRLALEAGYRLKTVDEVDAETSGDD